MKSGALLLFGLFLVLSALSAHANVPCTTVTDCVNAGFNECHTSVSCQASFSGTRCVGTLIANTCFVNDVCYEAGESPLLGFPPSTYECRVCEPSFSTLSFLQYAPGTSCSADGRSCTNEQCNSSGDCAVTSSTCECGSVGQLPCLPYLGLSCPILGIPSSCDVPNGVCYPAPPSGICYIDGDCQSDGEEANACGVCDSSISGTVAVCDTSALSCASYGLCTDGVTCEPVPDVPNTCLIDGVCYNDGDLVGVCGVCNSALSNTEASPFSVCANDGRTCTAEFCNASGACDAVDTCACDVNLDCPSDACYSGVCNFAAGTCGKQVLPGTCLIAGSCYVTGDQAGTTGQDACRQCRPSTSQTGWTLVSSGPCNNDGRTCTLEQCTTIPFSGTICATTGTNNCQCNTDSGCTAPLPGFCYVNKCNYSNGTCGFGIAPNTCLIDGQCYNNGQTNPANLCQICSTSNSSVSWTTDLATCEIDGSCYSSGAIKPSYPCLTCSPSANRTTWTIESSKCYIDGVCYSNAQRINGFSSCSQCTANQTQTAWSATPDGTDCAFLNRLCVDEECNGFGSCVEIPSTDTCQCDSAADCPFEATCRTPSCSYSTGVCSYTTVAGFCHIDGVCYADGALNPSSECRYCNSSMSATAWSLVPLDTPCVFDSHGLSCSSDTCSADGFCSRDNSACECLYDADCISVDSSCFAADCDEDGVCNDVPLPGHCFIDGVCYSNGTSHGPCLVCASLTSFSSWSPAANGLPCSPDSRSCTADQCVAGECEVTDTCFCDTEADCPPATDTCFSVSCDFASGTCSESLQADFCYIGGECYAEGHVSSSNPCDVCNPSHSVDSWSQTLGTCEIGGNCYVHSAVNPLNQCQVCNSVLSSVSWSSKPDETVCSTDIQSCTTEWCQLGVCAPNMDTCECSEVRPCPVPAFACFEPSCDVVSGVCSETLRPGHCFIDGECHLDGDVNGLCQTCVSSSSTSTWTNRADGFVCDTNTYLECAAEECQSGVCELAGLGSCLDCIFDDDCTALSVCQIAQCSLAGVCEHSLIAGHCLIDGVCHASGASNPASPQCQQCIPSSSTSAWTNLVSSCVADNRACTVDQCVAGACVVASSACDCDIGGDCPVTNQACFTSLCDFSSGACSAEQQNPNTCYLESTCLLTGDPLPSDSCQVCSSSGSTIPLPGHCHIDGFCYQDGASHPTVPCLECNLSNSESSWSVEADTCYNEGVCYDSGHLTSGGCQRCPLSHGEPGVFNTWEDLMDGTACDDSTQACDVDQCVGGVCTVVDSGACECLSDEDCSQFTSSCSVGICYAGSGVCFIDYDPSYCQIDGVCYMDGEHSLSSFCQICDVSSDQFDWTNRPYLSLCPDQDGRSCTKEVCAYTEELEWDCVSAIRATELACSDPIYPLQSATCVDGHETPIAPFYTCACESAANCTVTDPVCFQATCDHSSGECSPEGQVSGTCFIGGTCYTDGDLNPAAQCQVCDSTTSQSSWTNRPDNIVCDLGDGRECTNEYCVSGHCTIASNTCECDTDSDCPSPSSQCFTSSCSVALGTCSIHPIAGTCWIDGVCYANGDLNPANECQRCDTALSIVSWRNKANGSPCTDETLACDIDSCQSGVCTSNSSSCDCTSDAHCPITDSCFVASCDLFNGACSEALAPSSCYIGGVCYSTGDLNPANECEACRPSLSTNSWRPKIDGSFCSSADVRSCTVDQCVAGVCSVVSDSCGCGDDADCPVSDAECFAASCDFPSGACSETQNEFTCYIEEMCFSDGDEYSSCQMCDSSVNATSFTNVGDGTSCVFDYRSCTQDQCSSGVCIVVTNTCECDTVADCPLTNPACFVATCDFDTGVCDETQNAGTCYIDGACHANGAPHPTLSCLVCDATANSLAWSPRADGTICSADGRTCTSEQCSSGVCVISSDSCACDTDADCATPGSCFSSSCNVTVGMCNIVQEPGTCFVEGLCYNNGDSDPINPQCRECNAVVNAVGWTSELDGTPCVADSRSCTSDQCVAGSCSVVTNNCACDAVEDCTVTDDACFSAACDFSSGECSETQNAGTCYIDGVCYVTNAPHPTLPCKLCRPSLSKTSWSNRAEGTTCTTDSRSCTTEGCLAGQCVVTADSCACDSAGDCLVSDPTCFSPLCDFATGVCSEQQQQGTCYINGVCYLDGAANHLNPCQECRPLSNPTAWSAQADSTICELDNLPCTVDRCSAGQCSRVSSTCECFDASHCNFAPGPCFDAQCVVGMCEYTQHAANCFINGQCHAAGDPHLTSECLECSPLISNSAWTPVINGTVCEDNGLCGGSGACSAGLCQPGVPPLVCNDGDVCTFDLCDDETGCMFPPDRTTCPDEECEGSCTLSQGYWKTHHKYASNGGLLFPWPQNSEDTVLCGKTWYEWSQLRTKNLVWRKLFSQWLAARLNKLAFACMPNDTQLVFNQATQLLELCDLTLRLRNGSPQTHLYKELAASLENYNTGVTGPGHCAQDDCTKVPFENDDDDYALCASGGVIQSKQAAKRVRSTALVTVNSPMHTFSQQYSLLPQQCTNGIWDVMEEACYCNLGWTGDVCQECEVADAGRKYLCIPTFTDQGDHSGFLLRTVSEDQVFLYLQGSLPPMSPAVASVVPGEGELDCECRVVASKRYFHHFDEYISHLEHHAEWCEEQWSSYTHEYPEGPPQEHDEHHEHTSYFAHFITFLVISVVLAVIILILWCLPYNSSRKDKSNKKRKAGAGRTPNKGDVIDDVVEYLTTSDNFSGNGQEKKWL